MACSNSARGCGHTHATTSTPLLDLRIFFAAARVAAQGGNPYNPRTLAAMEQRLFPTYGPLHGARALALPYMHGPLPLLALRPFATWTTALSIVVLLALVGILVASCSALAATWPGSGWGLFVALVAGLPITIEEIALGQLTLVVLAGMTGGIVLARRGHLTAGMALAVVAASVKPHLGVLAVCGVAASAGWRLGWPLWRGLLVGGAVLLAGAWLAGGVGGHHDLAGSAPQLWGGRQHRPAARSALAAHARRRSAPRHGSAHRHGRGSPLPGVEAWSGCGGACRGILRPGWRGPV